MSTNLDGFIGDIQRSYNQWSDALPFATTHTSDIGNFEIIQEQFPIPDRFTLQELQTNSAHENIVDKLKQLEVRDFLENLFSNTPTFHNTTTRQNLVATLETTFNELFKVVSPDFIIWSEGIKREFGRQATDAEKQRMNERRLGEFLVRTEFNDIILGVRQHFGKTYHNGNRLNIRQEHDPTRALTILTISIMHRINISESLAYARITVS